MENIEQKTNLPGNLGKILLGIFILAFAIAAALIAFRVVKEIVASWEITDLPGVAIQQPFEPTAIPGADEPSEASESLSESSQAPQIAGPTPEPWDGASRSMCW